MATTSRNKVIQVQKPAQSLTAFQQKVASGDDIKEGYLKPLLIAAGSVLVVMVGVFSIRAIRASGIEKFETSLAELQTEVSGDGMAPVPPAEL